MKYVSIAFTDRLVSIVYADRCRDIFIDIEDTIRVFSIEINLLFRDSLEVLGRLTTVYSVDHETTNCRHKRI